MELKSVSQTPFAKLRPNTGLTAKNQNLVLKH